MPDTLTGYLALILGGFPSIGLYSGVNGFSLVRGCDGRHYRLRNAIYLGNRIFVRGFVPGKRILQVKEYDQEGYDGECCIFVNCSQRFAF